MTKYFDDRYLEDSDPDGGLMKAEEVKQTRARARKALEVAKELKKSHIANLERVNGASPKKEDLRR